jgi:hypothetical protein
MHDGQPPHSNAWPLLVWGPLVSRDQSSRLGGSLSRRDRVGIPARTTVPELIRHKFISTKGCLA